MSIIVVDTNYFISKLAFIKELAVLANHKTTIVTPFAVVQELDGLKLSEIVGQKAREATDYLLHEIPRSTRIVGQRQDQVIREEFVMDDKILDCCLYFKSKGYTVYLLTEDKNLSLKATIHEIQIPANITAADLVYFIQHEFMMDIDSDHEQHSASVDILVDLNQILVNLNGLLLSYLSPAFHSLVLHHYGDSCTVGQPENLHELVLLMEREYQKSIPVTCFENPYFKFGSLKLFARDIGRSLRMGGK